MPSHGPSVIFRDSKGRFLPQSMRYRPEVSLVQVWRSGRFVDLDNKAIPPKTLVDVLSRTEFEKLKEATVPLKDYKSKSKYKAWDIASQIDKTKGIRRKELKLTVTIQDGRRRKNLVIYHKIKRNSQSNYRIFQRINEELGFAGFFLYDKVGGKHLADRKGRQVKLIGLKMEEVL